jgi:hypothetical protein
MNLGETLAIFFEVHSLFSHCRLSNHCSFLNTEISLSTTLCTLPLILFGTAGQLYPATLLCKVIPGMVTMLHFPPHYCRYSSNFCLIQSIKPLETIQMIFLFSIKNNIDNNTHAIDTYISCTYSLDLGLGGILKVGAEINEHGMR